MSENETEDKIESQIIEGSEALNQQLAQADLFDGTTANGQNIEHFGVTVQDELRNSESATVKTGE